MASHPGNPPSSDAPHEQALDRVALAALGLVEDGMLLGLGTGRTAEAFLRRLGERVAEGLRVRGVATSRRSAAVAARRGIELATLDEVTRVDLDFDGADEVAPSCDLTKGLGGALVRERVVAHVADRFVVLVTRDKLVERLGMRAPVAVETVAFAAPVVARELQLMGATVCRRCTDTGAPFVSDNGNAILDAHLGPLDDPRAVAAAIRALPGVVDTGLFLGMADLVLVGSPDGVDRLTP